MSHSITVYINQVSYTLPHSASLQNAIEVSGVKPPFAAAINLRFVPRSDYAQQALADQDHIELISPITGG